ncbi:hypothetical protein ACHAW5_007450 [Stephanodiscus triporus]|uniref:RING-type domain-containing protein n=1 Tax=Stephanodiscus triporus TaxID=2934178 RepID=A0ABD3NQV7_9STRA
MANQQPPRPTLQTALTPNSVDVCIIADKTGSMSSYLRTLGTSLPEIISMIPLCDSVDKVGVFAYGDYCDKEVTKWSGWKTNVKELMPFVEELNANGGGDTPEAAKTAIRDMIANITKDTKIIFYTDAPPHLDVPSHATGNAAMEKEALGDDFDWIALCTRLESAGGECWFIVPSYIDDASRRMYSYMSSVTGGKTLAIPSTSVEIISKTTIGILLSIMGHSYDFAEVSEFKFTPDSSFCPPQLEDHLLRGQLSVLDNVLIESACQVNDAGQQLLKKFKTHPEFKDKVYGVFENILVPSRIKALTYNSMFGGVWRAICSDRLDPRRLEMLNKLSAVISAMGELDKELMKTFVEESYNQEAEIEIIINAVADYDRVPAVQYFGDSLDSKQILAITRSCDAKSLHQLGGILRNLVIVNSGGIPLKLSDMDFFCCLPSLASHGIMFSHRSSLVLAMLVVYTEAEMLMEKALRLLNSRKGKWLRQDQSENFSYGFTKFALSVQKKMEALDASNGLLTEAEFDMYTKLHEIWGYKINENTCLSVETPFSSKKTKRPDHKIPCRRCKKRRSFTLFNKERICGMCLTDSAFTCWDPTDSDPTKSYWCECSVCAAHYAVEYVAGLNVKPKCHFCRFENGNAPVVQCVSCHNKFVNCLPDIGKGDDWKCPICVVEKPAAHMDSVSIKEYVGGLDDIFAAKSLWAAKDLKISDVTFPTLWKNKPVLNVENLRADVAMWVSSEKAELGTCMFCFDDMNKNRLSSMCFRKKCSSRACVECLKGWYGIPKPGCVVNICNLKCAFCREDPSVKVLRNYNTQLCAIKDMPTEWLHEYVYAWCVRCYKIKKYMDRECTGGDAGPGPTNFVCEDCADVPVFDSDVRCRGCPSCGVMVEKMSGCDHITCICNAHWCFACGELSTEGDIYKHMSIKHGGYGGYNEDYYEDESDGEY